jgi:hypothetical protein
MLSTRSTVTALLMAAGITVGATGADATARRSDAALRAAAARVTTQQANAMQARAVAHGEANTTLSNPYIEQKVTTPESTGMNATRVPAGGF